MRSKLLTMFSAGALLLASGCSEDFLETEPTEFISSEQIQEATEKNPELQEANIAGLYATMIATGTGGTDLRHTDFGQKNYDIFSDMLSSDMVLAGTTYGWYSNISQMTTTIDFTNITNYMVWRYYYRIIFGANNIIDSFGGTDVVPESESAKAIVGQAKTMRAHSYFYLAQLMQEGYDPSAPILPLYTGVTEEPAPLSPASEIYDLIVSDLQDAISLMENFNRESRSAVNQDIAKALLAYTYGFLGDNDAEVVRLTREIIETGGYPLTDSEATLGGFNSLESSPSWMWGVDLTSDNGLDLVSWWGQMDLFTYSYAWAGDPKTIDEGLYNQIPEDDVRKQQWVDAYGDGVLYPINKFYDPGRTVAGQRNVVTDYVYMRVDEMYLLHAEYAAKSGDEARAQEVLKMFLAERLPDASYVDGLSGQDLLDEIYLQTRIEFWGEGKSYLAMNRNRATITRGANHLSFAGESFSYDDDRLSFEVPQSEVQNNPNITQQ